MNTAIYMPHHSLQQYIQIYMHTSVGDLRGKMEIDLFPVGHGILTFILDEEYFLYNIRLNKYYNVRFNFTGQLDHYHHLITSSASMISVVFKPYGSFQLLGIPQQLLVNDCTLVTDMFGRKVSTLCNKLEDHATDPLQVIKILENWLIGQLQKNKNHQTDRIINACNQIMIHKGKLPIKELYNLSNMSKSSLEHHFKEQVGLSPKMFSRIIRFNQAHKFIKDTATSDWQELIYQYGYFDQSHFIHEFKHFFGYTPSQIHLSLQNLAGHTRECETDATPQSL